jgi:hypothetical protein
MHRDFTQKVPIFYPQFITCTMFDLSQARHTYSSSFETIVLTGQGGPTLTTSQRRWALLAIGIVSLHASCSCNHNGVVVDPLGGHGGIVKEEPRRAVWRDVTGDKTFGQEEDK